MEFIRGSTTRLAAPWRRPKEELATAKGKLSDIEAEPTEMEATFAQGRSSKQRKYLMPKRDIHSFVGLAWGCL